MTIKVGMWKELWDKCLALEVRAEQSEAECKRMRAYIKAIHLHRENIEKEVGAMKYTLEAALSSPPEASAEEGK